MALLARLKALLTRRSPMRRPGTRQATTAARSEDLPQEATLRAKLVDDPNDIQAFRELAELVRRRADSVEPVDPLIAEHERAEHHIGADVAIWALAEELAGSPRAWYPLIELARLSLHDDHEGAMRRLNAACEREHTGLALAEGVRTLREAELPGDGLGLGVGQWSPRDHVPEAGRQIVLAALDAERPLDARRHLEELKSRDDAETRAVVTELEPRVAAAERL
ncbi:hypothetical protein [Oceanitalea stevensii]|uniref:hypothetical protein n=1 Tax=Oceanitalea stevensii TaxID=2763072 RepID=UPI002044CF02|nr:hypothetical protein [Oceanitalea stevensii]